MVGALITQGDGLLAQCSQITSPHTLQQVANPTLD